MDSAQRNCSRCGKEIPAERIEAIPETMVCVSCSSEMGGEFQIIAIAEKTSKEGSLKKNYGDYKLTRRPRHIERKVG